MKVLVISSTPWASDNSFGNSFSNIFEGIPDLEFANIFCKPGKPENNLNIRYYQIVEKNLLKSIFDRKIPTGYTVEKESAKDAANCSIKGTRTATKMRYTWMLWVRDVIWKLGRWKTDELIKFIDDFAPDIIVEPIYFSSYLNEMIIFAKEHTGKKLIGYVSDDNYTLRQFSLSPLYWTDRIIKRRYVKKAVESCELLYVISEIQKKEYEQVFTVPCKVLTKCADFSSAPELKKELNEPLKIVYTGNLGAGRWKSVSLITDALKEINRDGTKAVLYIYSATPLKAYQKSAIADGTNAKYMGAVASSEVKAIQQDADILVHAEGMNLRSRLQVHQSFSTKIVDYLKNARAIFAVGPHDAASIDYFISNGSAVVATDKSEVESKLREYIDSKENINLYAQRSYACGREHHSADVIKKMVYDDLKNNI